MKTSQPLKCYLSEKGHKNFWDPTSEQIIIPTGCDYENLNWLSGRSDLKAIKILKECVLPIECKKLTVENMSPPFSNKYIVVWVDKTHIPA